MKKTFLSLFSLLILFSCSREEPWDYDNIGYQPDPLNDINNGTVTYDNGGVISDDWDNNIVTNPLIGTTWVITRYTFNFNTSTYPNDTIKFITNNTYQFNSSTVNRTYSITRMTTNNRFSLRINFLPTLGGGVYTGELPIMFVEDGFVNKSKFVDIEFDRNYYVWLEKI